MAAKKEVKEEFVKVYVIKSLSTMAYTAGHSYTVTVKEATKLKKLKMIE